MAVNLERLRNVQVSAATAETSYDTESSVDSLIRFNLGAIPNEAIETINDQDQIGGTEEASDAELIAKSLSFPFSQNRVKPHTLAFVAAYGLGSASTTTPSGASNARKHTITPMSSTTQPSFSLEGKRTSSIQKLYTGLMIDSFTCEFTRGANRFLNINGTALGSGTITDATGTASEVSEGGINVADGAVWLDNTTYSGSTGDDLDTSSSALTSDPSADSANTISVNWGYQNNMDAEFLYEIGSGDVFGNSERLARTQTLTYTRLYQDETYQSGLSAQTEYALQVMVRNAEIENGFYYGMNLIFPLLQLQNREIQNQGGRLHEVLTFFVLQDSTHGSVILDVFNTQTGYAA